jgi:hypothetical protein
MSNAAPKSFPPLLAGRFFLVLEMLVDAENDVDQCRLEKIS